MAVIPSDLPPNKRGRSGLGTLPEWDLSDLYPGRESAELAADLDQANRESEAFRATFQDRLAGLSGSRLGAAVLDYQTIHERLGRLSSYGQLEQSRNLSDPETSRFAQTLRERISDIASKTLFFCLEINRIDDAALGRLLEDPTLARFAPWLRDVRAFRPYQLADDIEQVLHDKTVTGRGAWTRLFDETLAELRFEVDGQSTALAKTLDLMSDRRAPVRRTAAKALGKGLTESVRTIALITNTLAKDKDIEDRWRGFKRPVSSRNLGNFVEDEVVDALVGTVRDAFPRLSHRYYTLKARWLGVETLDHWDRNAPLPDSDDRQIPWDEARDTVLDAYGRFSAELAAVGRRFFDAGWIDAPARPGKSPGAFAHPTVPGVHPYLLLNYMGKTRDVMTLAHELGHGVHQVLAGHQGHLMAATPLTLAETASVFGEMLTFRAMLDSETDPVRRKVMLAGKVEDMLNTVVRQIAFHFFEEQVHAERQRGELTADRLGEIWLAVQRESLGPAFRFDDEYRYFWSYVPHFIHVPFYVYAYAFGDCLVNSLYAVYQDAEAGFAGKYLDMLRAGGTRRHKELLAPFGLDAGDPAFWGRGVAVVEGLIDELEAL